jgi:succinyl-CoA synthetase beta subunit
MDIHEYQAKELLSGYGVFIPMGGLAYSAAHAAYRASAIEASSYLVKAQIHTGGRFGADGIVRCISEEEIRKAAENLMGKRLVTRYTGPEGREVHRLYIEEEIDVSKEYYVGFVLDRQMERIIVIASTHGGMDIETLSKQNPESVLRIIVEPAVGMQAFQARQIAFWLSIDKSLMTQAVTTLLGCYRAFRDLDATLVEMNPLALTSDGRLVALDAKMSFDDYALFRRQNIANLRDKTQEDPLAKRASDYGMNYVRLEGNIGCIVNGAGLAMATLDMIKSAGGESANFLDIGLGAMPIQIKRAVNLIRDDSNVKTILVNIFAGINRCDWIAEGLLQAVEKFPHDVEIIVRLDGTNAKTGRNIINQADTPIIMADSFDNAIDKAVASASRK